MIRTFVIGTLFFIAGTSYGQNGVCCDLDGVNYAGPGACSGAAEPAGTYSEEGVACDPDCSNYNVCDPAGDCYTPSDSSCNVPIDGGLGLLAMAGGGLAMATLRRRRKELPEQASA